MIVIRKSHLRRALTVTLLVALLVGVAATVTFAQSEGGVNITTPPIKIEEIYIDVNNNGVHDIDEFVGVFPVYDGNLPLEFYWEPYPFAEGANGSYRISLWQMKDPLTNPTFVELKVAHHWASNPNGTSFVMGGFGFGEEICSGCPTFIIVEAETYVLYFDPTVDSYEYEYTPVGAAYVRNQGDSGFEYSDPFVLEIIRPGPPEKEPDECTPTPLKCGTENDGKDNDCDGKIDEQDENVCL